MVPAPKRAGFRRQASSLAAMGAAVEDRQTSLRDLEAELRVAEQGVTAVRAELEAARSSAKAVPDKAKERKTVDIVQQEIKVTSNFLGQHRTKEGGIKDSVDSKFKEWEDKKVKLKADLHRSEMELRMATEDMTASTTMRKVLTTAHRRSDLYDQDD